MTETQHKSVNTTPVSLSEVKVNELLHGEQVFGLRDLRHGELVLQGTRLLHVERGLAREDRLPVLDRLHGAHRKTAPVSGALHLVQHRNLRIP